MRELSELSKDDLDHVVGQDVAVNVAGHQLSFRLLRAMSRGGRKAGRAPFDLVFAGPRAVRTPQMTMTFTFTDVGEYELFAVPVGLSDPADPDSGLLYQVCFN